jgi:serine/threonine protein kinase/uncharacterized protein YjbI with pentapeptide repeats
MQDLHKSLSLSCTFKMVQGVLQQEGKEHADQAANGPLAAGTVIDAKYRIVSFLGAGGMGAVYRANHLSLGKDVALKTLRSSDLSSEKWERFQREAQAIGKLENKNIVRVYDFGVAEGNHPYYTMELLCGESLADRVSAKGALPLSEALMIFAEVANGLVSAHARGIVHRDLKPENIFLVLKDDKVVSVKLVDFGIAKLAGAGDLDGQRLTAVGSIFGSPLYMSPEQSMGEDTDARSDIYSFGCALYETLTGRPPFMGTNAFFTICSHQGSQPPTLADSAPATIFPHWIESLISRMLAKKKEDRVQSFQEVLQEFTSHQSVGQKASLPRPKKIAQAEVPRPVLSDDLGELGGGAKERSPKNAIFAMCFFLLAAGAAVCTFRDRIWPEPIQPHFTNVLAPAAKSAVLPTALPVQGEGAPVRFFQRLDRTHSIVCKVFKFGKVSIGNFHWGEDARAADIPCIGTASVPEGDNWNFEPSGLVWLRPTLLKGFRNDDLTSIDFNRDVLINCSWTNAQVHYITHLSGLQKLSMRGSNIDGNAIEDIGTLKSLSVLDVTETGITGQDLLKLANLDSLKHLIVARLFGMPQFLKGADKSNLKLEYINLKGDGLADSDLQEVAKIKTLSALTLDDNPKVTAAGIKYLLGLSGLTSLHLTNVNIGPAELNVLGQFKNLTGLTISGPLSAASRARLKQLLPGCFLTISQPRSKSFETEVQ